MKKSINKMAEELRLYWKNYILQSLLAAISIFIVLLFLNLQEGVIIASIGATAFIVFAMPKDFTATPRHVIGGHIVGIISGSLCALIPHSAFIYAIIIYSLAVGLSILIMVITDTEHPPAAGTALGVALRGFSVTVSAAVIVSVLILSLVHYLLKDRLKNLV